MLIEVPHFASLRGNEREITILRSDNGQTWREHSTVATEEAVQDALEGSFSGQFRFLCCLLSSYFRHISTPPFNGLLINFIHHNIVATTINKHGIR